MITCSGCEYHNWNCGDYGACHWCEHPSNINHYKSALKRWAEFPDIEKVNNNNDCKFWTKRLTLKDRFLNWIGGK